MSLALFKDKYHFMYNIYLMNIPAIHYKYKQGYISSKIAFLAYNNSMLGRFFWSMKYF